MAARKQHSQSARTRTGPHALAPTARRAATLALAIALAVGAAKRRGRRGQHRRRLAPRRQYASGLRQATDGNGSSARPGQEYGVRVCNTTGERVLAVMSVDGVNIVSGETASPSQSGYVLSAYECADINGWRKSQSSTAAFYFTELPDAYAARTGRPDNVGVIGVAFFRERPERIVWKESSPKIGAATPGAEAAPGQAAAAPRAMRAAVRVRKRDGGGQRAADSATPASAAMPAPAPLAKIGTGHGRQEQSYVQNTHFVRESATPNQTLAINYDRRENLIAMGDPAATFDRAQRRIRFPAGRRGSCRIRRHAERTDRNFGCHQLPLSCPQLPSGAGRSHTCGRCPRPPSPPKRATRT